MVSFTKDFLQAIIIIAIVVALNLIGFVKYGRADLTEDGIHTLTDGFKDLLQNDVEDVIFVKCYLAGEGFPAQVENLRRNVEDMLIEFNRESDGMVKYEFIDPDADKKLAETLLPQLEKAGLAAKMVREQHEGTKNDIIFWPGAIIEYGQSKTESVQFIAGGPEIVNNYAISTATDQLEYNFMQAFRKLTRKVFPHIGFLQGHGELSENQTISVRAHLGTAYKVDQVELKDASGKELIYALNDYDGLVVAQPKIPFTEKEKFILDQFIMKGGRVAWLIDPLNMQEDTLFKKGQTMALPFDLNIDDMLFSYGARINDEMLLTDFCAPTYNFQKKQPEPWYFYALSRNSNRDPVASNLNPIKMKYASPVEPVGDSSIKKRVLLETSPNSKVFKNPARISLAFLDPLYRPKFEGGGIESRPTALMLEGNFKSFYTNSIDPAFKNSDSLEFREQVIDGKMLVVGDGDFIENKIRRSLRPGSEIDPDTDIMSPDMEPIAAEPYPAYSNVDFFSNAIDDLMEQDKMVALRGREFKQRPLSEEYLSDKGAKSALKFTNVALPIILLILFGVIQYFVRRAKFAKR